MLWQNRTACQWGAIHLLYYLKLQVIEQQRNHYTLEESLCTLFLYFVTKSSLPINIHPKCHMSTSSGQLQCINLKFYTATGGSGSTTATIYQGGGSGGFAKTFSALLIATH